jgi:hypothetical protein
VGRGDYLGAAEALDGVKKRVEKVLMEISSATTPQPSRRRG